jgi:lipopolysaccharide export system protein LptC
MLNIENNPAVPRLDSALPHWQAADRASHTGDYSRFVRIAKILLPSTAAGLFLVVVLYSAFHNSVSDLTVSLNKLHGALGGQLEMTNPTLTYTDDADRAFFVNAGKAVQTGSRDLWHLERIHGRMVPPQGRGYKLTSDTGRLDASKKLLDLAGRVLVVSDEGYTFEARSAHIDMTDDRVTSEEPVRAHGGATTISSDRFEMWDKGAKLRFEGRVHFVSESAPRAAAAPQKPGGAAP